MQGDMKSLKDGLSKPLTRPNSTCPGSVVGLRSGESRNEYGS